MDSCAFMIEFALVAQGKNDAYNSKSIFTNLFYRELQAGGADPSAEADSRRFANGSGVTGKGET